MRVLEKPKTIDMQNYFNKKLYLLVFLAGAITIFAFSPFTVYPLAWLTPAVLFYALTKAESRKQFFALGFFYGLGLLGVGASWPFYSMYFFAHAPLVLALGATFLFVVIIAVLTTGFFGLLVSLFRYRTLSSRLLLFYPAAWVLLEWWKGWFLTGFPWLNIGSSQIDSILASYAPVTGVLGVSWVSVMIGAAILYFFIGTKESMRVNSTSTKSLSSAIPSLVSPKVTSILVLIVLLTLAIVLASINWTEKIGKPITVSVLQPNISQLEKLDPQNLKPSLALYKVMTEKSSESDLIVWPETAVFDLFRTHMNSLIIPLQQSLKDTEKSILMGGFHVNDSGNIENSILSLSEDKREVYSKRHLVPFGEYIPLLNYVKWLGDWIPRSNLQAGNSDGLLSVAGYTAQMSICYEDAFGEEIITGLPQANLLINVTHDGWFSGSFEPEQHMQIARMRSLETGRYMVRATTMGPSGIINEKGKLIATAPIYTKKVITHQVQPFTGSTPYVRWGNWFIVSILSLVLFLGFLWKSEEKNNGNT